MKCNLRFVLEHHTLRNPHLDSFVIPLKLNFKLRGHTLRWHLVSRVYMCLELYLTATPFWGLLMNVNRLVYDKATASFVKTNLLGSTQKAVTYNVNITQYKRNVGGGRTDHRHGPTDHHHGPPPRTTATGPPPRTSTTDHHYGTTATEHHHGTTTTGPPPRDHTMGSPLRDRHHGTTTTDPT